MLRLRFVPGLILGLVIGVPLGGLLAVLLRPAPASDTAAATSAVVQELTRKLEAAREDKLRVDQQLEQFTKLANQMTAGFNALQRRFKALEEEGHTRDLRTEPHEAAATGSAPTATPLPVLQAAPRSTPAQPPSPQPPTTAQPRTAPAATPAEPAVPGQVSAARSSGARA
jgi:uncharacterized membrane protein